MDEDAGSMERVFNCGAGGVVSKSIGLEPKNGYPNPTVVELDYGILNAMGLPNPGINHYGEEIDVLKDGKFWSKCNRVEYELSSCKRIRS
jgi:dihydroorotate dehydrogenase (NAD+) catalytic subunit